MVFCRIKGTGSGLWVDDGICRVGYVRTSVRTDVRAALGMSITTECECTTLFSLFSLLTGSDSSVFDNLCLPNGFEEILATESSRSFCSFFSLCSESENKCVLGIPSIC